MTDVIGSTRTTDPVDRVRRWARIQLAAIVLVVVALITAMSFRIPALAYVSVLRPILLIGLIVGLGELLRVRGVARADLLTALGLAGVAAELGSLAVALWVPIDLPVYLSVVAAVLVPLWLFGVGWVGRRQDVLPKPLPRRAMIGAVGQGLLAFSSPFNLPLGLVITLLGLALAIPTLGFLFGLASLEPSGAGPLSMQP